MTRAIPSTAVMLTMVLDFRMYGLYSYAERSLGGSSRMATRSPHGLDLACCYALCWTLATPNRVHVAIWEK